MSTKTLGYGLLALIGTPSEVGLDGCAFGVSTPWHYPCEKELP
jgi:hypothetical protein